MCSSWLFPERYDLYRPDYPGASRTSAEGINSAGTIVGTYYGSAAHGFSLNGTTHTPVDYPGGSWTFAYGINSAGTIVGTYYDAGYLSHGFSLNGTTHTPVDYPGALETWAYGINDRGTIVGTYYDAGYRPHGFRATPDLELVTVIDIKPGDVTNSINPKSNGKIPVAILSTKDFHAPSQVDPTSLTFGRIGSEQSLVFCSGLEDANGDGLQDLICHFYTSKTEFQCGDTQGILKGKTTAGTPMQGSDSVKIVPCK